MNVAARTWPGGWHVRYVAETGSTNDDLVAAATSLPDRCVLYTDHQTAGRGRLGRRWDAPPGANLLASLLFHQPSGPPVETTHRAGLAVIDACRAVGGVEAVLKWPNDVLLDGRKLAGILAQRTAEGSIVVGVGINVAWAPPGAARLVDGIAVPDLLSALLAAHDALPPDVTARYRAALDTLGRRVRVELASRSIEGTATGVAPDGRLVVVDSCAVSHAIDAGDVVHLRDRPVAGGA